MPSSFRGPFVVVAIGGSVAFVGMVPVVVTMTLGVRSSATIIGVGFIGFGLLIVLPGLCWCIVVQVHNCRTWHRSLIQRLSSNAGPQDETSSLDVIPTGNSYGGTSAKQSENLARTGISLTPQPSREITSTAVEDALIITDTR